MGREPDSDPPAAPIAATRSEERFRDLVAGLTDAILWEGDPETLRFTYVSPAAEALLGYPAEQWLSDPEFWIAHMHPEDRAWAVDHCVRETSAGRDHEFDYRMIAADGRVVWLRDKVYVGRGADGRPVSRGLMLDITEWKKTDEALRLSEERFASFMSQLPGLAWIKDLEGRYVFANEAALETFGVRAEELYGRTDEEIFSPDTAVQFRGNDARALASKAGIQTIETLTDENGVPHHSLVNKFPLAGPDGRVGHIGGVAIDITELRDAQEALGRSEERYRAIVESQTEMVCRFRPDGTLLFVNGAYARELDATPETLEGRNLWDFVPEAERAAVQDDLDRLTPDAPEIRIENRFMSKDGERWTLWTNRALSFDADGRWLEAQATGLDITDRKRAEEHRQLLLDELNHRVRNTLAVVQGVAHQTFTAGSASEEARRTFEGRLAALAGAHGVLTRTNWESAALRELIEDAATACGPSGARVAFSGPPVTLKSKHALAIAMALHELCTNAVKYGALSTDAGEVSVSWSVTAERRLEVIWRERGGPTVSPPTRRGFGSLMIERGLAQELQGEAALTFAPDGLECVIRAPLPEPSRGGA